MKTSISIIDEGTDKMPFVLRGEYENSIKKAADLGFDAVEMHIRKPGIIDPFKINDYCRKSKIRVSSIGTGLSYGLDGLSLMSSDYGNRLKAVERMKEYITLAKELDAVVIVGLIKGLIPEKERYDKCIELLKQSLYKCIDEAEKRDVILAFEAINRYESNFLTKIDEMIHFLKGFKSRALNVHIDTYHMNIEEADMCESIMKCKDMLGHVHIADNDRMYPGHGHISFDKLFESLDLIGYKGYLAVECLALPSPEICAEHSIQFFKNYKKS